MNRLSGTSIIKIHSIVLISLLTFLLYVIYSTYPLNLTMTQGFLSQIPVVYWILLILVIWSITAFVYVLRTPRISLLCTIIFYLIFSSYQFFHRGLYGGDYTFRNYVLLETETKFSPETHFSYLEFSHHWLFHRIRYLIIDLGFDTLTNIEVGFFLNIIIFAIGIWFFVYNNTANSFYTFLGSSLFFIIAHPFLNFQYVPQFFALILLTYLLAIHHKQGQKWFIIKTILFIALVLSHRMIFVFYIGAVLISPIAYGLLDGIKKHSPATKDSIIVGILLAFRSPSSFLRVSYQSARDYSHKSWLMLSLSLVSIYFTIYLYHFVIWQQHMIGYLTASHRGHTQEFLARFGINIGTSEETDTAVQATTQRLYHLSSAEVASFTTLTAIIVIVMIGILLTMTSLQRPTHRYSPLNLSVAFVAFLYFIVGSVLNILGTRALQILFLPFVLSLEVLNQKRIVCIFIVVVLLTASPVVIANQMNNAAMSGGHTTGDFYTEEAGEFIQEYDYETVIQARTTQYPVDVSGDKQHIWIGHLLDIPGQQSYQSEPGDIIQFDYRLYHDVDRHFHRCNFEDQHVIYDNTNQLMLVGNTPFECVPYE